MILEKKGKGGGKREGNVPEPLYVSITFFACWAGNQEVKEGGEEKKSTKRKKERHVCPALLFRITF